jgi:pimeloyl-ACP methyl ester carboxylesterase
VDCPVGKNDKLQCATIQVPCDYTTTNGKKLELHLVRQPAAKDAANARSIILNRSGPGASGIQFIVEGGASYQDIVGDNFYMVSFDPRGVGITTPYTCKGRKGDSSSYNTDDGLQTAYSYNTAQAKDCVESEYDDLVGTALVALNIKAISEAVGEDRLIRYRGFSYGTLLSLTFSAIFLDKMDRGILDGNINPTDYYRGL